MDAKTAAGREAARLVRDGMTIGLGSGSTAEKAIEALGERVAQGLRIRGVSSSARSEELARGLGIEVVTFSEVSSLDVTIDGADEIDSEFRLIKGGGGALVREKLVAAASREMIVVADASKLVRMLGRFPLPVAIIPFAWETTLERLDRLAPCARLRQRDGRPYVTDDGLYIVDLDCESIEDPEAVDAALQSLPGVVETGLFLNIATQVVIGHDNGHTETLTRP